MSTRGAIEDLFQGGFIQEEEYAHRLAALNGGSADSSSSGSSVSSNPNMAENRSGGEVFPPSNYSCKFLDENPLGMSDELRLPFSHLSQNLDKLCLLKSERNFLAGSH